MNFKIFGITISFEFGFFAAAAIFSLIDSLELGLSAACGCIIHECGHIFAAVITDVKIEKITFRTGGIKMRKEGKLTGFSKNIFMLLCGPLFNLIGAVIYYRLGALEPFSVNLILGLFNLLPFSALDGGNIIAEILEYAGIFPDKPLKITAVISFLLISAFLYFSGTGTLYSYGTAFFLLISEFFYCK